MKVSLPAAIAVVVCACAPAPINRPIKGGDVDTGAGSLEAVRRQLQGTWALTSYEIYRDGKRERLGATARLTYDEFGNLKMDGRLTRPDATGATKPLMLNYSGRAVLDVVNHQLRLLDLEPSGDDLPTDVARAADWSNVRRYDLRGNVLTLTIVAANGTPSAASAWHKEQQP